MGLQRALVGGATAGLAGSALMWGLFSGAKRAGLLRETPPNRVIDRAAAIAAEATESGGPIDAEDRTAGALGSHLLFGAAAGAFYGLIQDELELPPLVAGPAYGLAIWAAAYIGWLPAARILPEPWDQRPGDALVPVAAHAVYGLTLSLFGRMLIRRR